MLTLLTAKYPDPEPIRQGCKLIMSRQLKDGSWAQESIEGIFNKVSRAEWALSTTVWVAADPTPAFACRPAERGNLVSQLRE